MASRLTRSGKRRTPLASRSSRNIKRGADSDAELPTAEDVVATVRNILSSTSTALPPTLAPTWRTRERRAGARRQLPDPRPEQADVRGFHVPRADGGTEGDAASWDEITQWVGDAWASIKNGAAAVNEFFIDFVEASIVVTYELGGLSSTRRTGSGMASKAP